VHRSQPETSHLTKDTSGRYHFQQRLDAQRQIGSEGFSAESQPDNKLKADRESTVGPASVRLRGHAMVMKKSSSSGSVSNINLQEQAEAPNPRGRPTPMSRSARWRSISLQRGCSTAGSYCSLAWYQHTSSGQYQRYRDGPYACTCTGGCMPSFPGCKCAKLSANFK
jgi:hypothetical protein